MRNQALKANNEKEEPLDPEESMGIAADGTIEEVADDAYLSDPSGHNEDEQSLAALVKLFIDDDSIV